MSSNGRICGGEKLGEEGRRRRLILIVSDANLFR